jgi:hypothetical protein
VERTQAGIAYAIAVQLVLFVVVGFGRGKPRHADAFGTTWVVAKKLFEAMEHWGKERSIVLCITLGRRCGRAAITKMTPVTPDMAAEESRFAKDGILLKTSFLTWGRGHLKARRLTEKTTTGRTLLVIAGG